MTVMASRIRKHRGNRKLRSHGDERRRRSNKSRHKTVKLAAGFIKFYWQLDRSQDSVDCMIGNRDSMHVYL